MIDGERTPVIVGVGTVTDRPDDWRRTREPLALMEDAARQAQADAGAPLLQRLSRIEVVNISSWRYANPAGLLASRLDAGLATAVHHPSGGDSPLRLLIQAAARIIDGETESVLICGGESQYAAAKAREADMDLGWTPWARDVARAESGIDAMNPMAVALGVRSPATVYPFYDVAASAAWGQTPDEALAESATLWAGLSRVAAANENAWLRKPKDAEEIRSATASNRWIAWPYTKLMVANPMVNQAAAVIVTSLANARRIGVAPSSILHIRGAAAAQEPRDLLARDQFVRSHAQDAVLETAMGLNGGDAFDAQEIYSCFPCVPKMARRTLDLGLDTQMTVIGGLTFHGAPVSNYMTHAIVGMARRLRSSPGRGLLYGQGEYVTKHAAVVVETDQTSACPDLRLEATQVSADARRAPAPALCADLEGPATVESATVLFDREGAPLHGVAVVRAGDDRAIARIDLNRANAYARLTQLTETTVGAEGVLHRGDDVLEFQLAD